MEDDNFIGLIAIEIRSFYQSITLPFLKKLSDSDRVKALAWSQRILSVPDYLLMKKYLILLSYMIISGHLVSPYDVDPNNCKLPTFRKELREQSIFDYVQKEINFSMRKKLREKMDTALSKDDMAFLAQLPNPKGGIKLYLTSSDESFNRWPKAKTFSPPTKYNISARDFVREGLALVQRKFDSYDEFRNKQAETTNATNFDFFTFDDNSSINCDECDVTSCSTNSQQQENVCVIEIPPNHRIVLREINNIVEDDMPDSPPRLNTEEDLQKEEKILRKLKRWFGNSIYEGYHQTIKKLMRRQISIDAIRRSIHKCMRQRYKRPKHAPLRLRDSLDESEPYPLRINHLKIRFADVLKNEYGITDEEKLYYLANIPAMSEDCQKKARELIRQAEEDKINTSVKQKFSQYEGRTCGKLLRLMNELFESMETASEPVCDCDPASCYERVSNSSQTTNAFSDLIDSTEISRLSFRHRESHENISSNLYPLNAHRPTEEFSSTSRCPLNENNPVNVCCPSGQNPLWQNQSLQPNGKERYKNFKLNDERADDLFRNLPSDTSKDESLIKDNKKLYSYYTNGRI